MGLKDKWNERLDKGIYIKKTWDIRVVENFFKKLFGKKKKKGKKNGQKRKRSSSCRNHRDD